MCTAVTYKTKDHYFGRTLDYEISYGERVVVMPRNFPLDFLKVKDMKNHYAMIGVATVRVRTYSSTILIMLTIWQMIAGNF